MVSVDKMIGLIDLVRENPCIYNHTLGIYKDTKNKAKIWKMIAEKLAVDNMDGKHTCSLFRSRLNNNFSSGSLLPVILYTTRLSVLPFDEYLLVNRVANLELAL